MRPPAKRQGDRERKVRGKQGDREGQAQRHIKRQK